MDGHCPTVPELGGVFEFRVRGVFVLFQFVPYAGFVLFPNADDMLFQILPEPLF